MALLFGVAVLLVPPVHADNTPTVTVTDYKVSPSVLLPGSPGTITITVKNTAASATVSEKIREAGTG